MLSSFHRKVSSFFHRHSTKQSQHIVTVLPDPVVDANGAHKLYDYTIVFKGGKVQPLHYLILAVAVRLE